MKDWVHVCRLDDIPRLGARVVKIGEIDVALFRTADDSAFAVRDRCPHKQGPLSQGIVHGHKVTCPLHNWVIDLESGVAQAPDRGCVQRYQVKVDGEMVALQLETPVAV